MNEHENDDAMLKRLLNGLGAGPVEDGFAKRVTRGVEARMAAAEARPARWRVAMWSLASAAAMLLCFAAVHELRLRSDAAPVPGSAATPLPLADSPRIARGAEDAAATAPPRRRPAPPRTFAAAAQPAAAALASFPAPEAPLTEQERLLLLIAHRRDPVEVAMLNPEELAREEALEAEEFQRMFPAPDPPPNDVPEDPSKEKGDTR